MLRTKTGCCAVHEGEEVVLEAAAGRLERVAGLLAFLAHHRGGGDQSQRAEAHGAAVAVGIGDHSGLQDTVVVLGAGREPDGVRHLHRKQMVGAVVGDRGVVAERVAHRHGESAARQVRSVKIERDARGVGEVAPCPVVRSIGEGVAGQRGCRVAGTPADIPPASS